ncbi:hypothetical protein SERLA73DRAFT_188375 [Serpula lacrymans var. lacrymans S7.3]|uniref:t-SNARE coiled-coil homology domain-containing protein n=2 Tax=Serpula lacrymans var. lacrymans TaxID=341189 RepID=F8QB81_SERL3|nr:uncharacterized protein SERLADRAFT_478465 [Serpula lacrymans var. lacrymans S7.9]EGN94467.1 hypothetical protein SERLA73DRAFT_188375 [Serpula lacrymans var. lacrymans S7.3]EGO19946.1 hypothetical protein SERLADRAFT_478465 [Serpula lacrymans var. lacrymans S7.9]
MSTSRVEDTYEAQNDQRLDELHSKIRTLRGVTTDIYDDAERQNLTLDDTSNSFSSFGATLSQSSRRASQAFGLGPGGVKQTRIIFYIVGGVIGLWILYKLSGFWWSSSAEQV